MIKQIVDILPHAFRRRGVGVACTLFLRALLNMVGLAMLLPILALALEPEALTGEGALADIYAWGDFNSPTHFAWLMAGAIIAIIALKCLLNFLLARTERRYIYDLYSHLSRMLYVQYHRLGMPYIKQHNSAQLTRNVNVVCLSFTVGVLKPAAAILSELLLLLFLFIALMSYAPAAALLTLGVFLPATWGYYRFVRRRINRYGEEENRAQREKARVVSETFRGYADIELCDAFPMMLRRFDRAMKEVVTTRSRESDIGLLPAMVTELGLAIGVALLAALSMSFGEEGGQLVFGIFAVAALRLMPSVRNLLASWTKIRYNRYTIRILRDTIQDIASDATQEAVEPLPFEHAVTIHDLSFTFPDALQPLFEGLSLTIGKGEKIGIRGASGVGKTTLFNLLLGFYEPTQGTIEIDDRRLNAQTRRRWQQRVGYVSQHLFVMDGSIAENVALGVPDNQIDRPRVMEVLESAQLGEWIAQQPQGIETAVGEGGCRLSGGQRQRLGIARALYRRADILFFDEATSSLDNHTEQEINQSIARLAAENSQLTLLVIAHRESSLAACDRVITLENSILHG